MYSFDSKIASRWYHVYRNSSWLNAKPGHKMKVEWETIKLSKSIDPYACAIKIKHQFFDTSLTVGHIPREISRLSYLFMDEGGNITRHLISTTYKISPIPAGGLEVSFLLTLTVKRERIFKLRWVLSMIYMTIDTRNGKSPFPCDYDMTTTTLESRQKTTRKRVVTMSKSV